MKKTILKMTTYEVSNEIGNSNTCLVSRSNKTDIVRKIKIIDSIMGSGKTTWAINHMNENTFGNSFIYITPFLDEVDRIKHAITNRNFIDPVNKGEGKLENLKELINEGQDIVTTHALFQKADAELISLIRANSYTLILDEVMNVVQEVKLRRHDLKLLIENGIIFFEDDGIVKWNNDKGYDDTKYNNIRELANLGTLRRNSKTSLIWTFPVEIFKAFKETYILTYYFEAQIQRYYYDLFEIEYEYFSVNKQGKEYVLVTKDKHFEDRGKYRDLINIHEENMNVSWKLSKTWFTGSNNRNYINQLKNNTTNYFRNILKASSEDCLWTTFKDTKNKLKGKGYTNGFAPCNARATNQYSHKTKLAYLLNRYMPVMQKRFFIDRDIKIDEDKWALSELLQWVWRSAIRNNQPIDIYIPSTRMRQLLNDWLDGEI